MERKNILFTYDYDKKDREKIESLGYNVIVKNDADISFSEELEDVEAMICYNPFKTLDISKMKKLKWIQLSSVGVDQIPKDRVLKQGILVTNNKGGYSIPIGEWIVLKILELLRKSKVFYKNQETKVWKWQRDLIELYGKKIGFVGTGNIATEAAKRLKAFETEIVGFNTTGREVKYFDKCFKTQDMDKVLPSCDIVVLTIPGTQKTRRMINDKTISFMKDGVYFVNISRGSIVDEKALISALNSGKIRGAALDVFEKEPLDKNNPLWEMENVIVTPHNSWISEMGSKRRNRIIYENLERYSRGEKLINLVNMNKGY